MSNEKQFILNAFPLSVEEMRLIKNKYPAFAARVLSDKAKEQEASCNNYGTGWTASRSAVPGSSSTVSSIDYDSTLAWNCALNTYDCTWVAFHHIYNPESHFVRSAKLTKYTARVWMPKNKKADKFDYGAGMGEMKEVTSEGYVSTFGGKQYLIVNYEEAKAAYEKDGTMLPMLCAEVGAHERAVAFSEENNNDFSKATKLHEQYERILIENATKEEKQYIVPTEFIREIKEKTPCYDKCVARVDLMKKKESSTSVEELFNSVFEGDISVEDLQAKLIDLIKDVQNKKGATVQDIATLREEIAEQAKALKTKLKEQLEKEANKAIEEVKNLDLGGLV